MDVYVVVVNRVGREGKLNFWGTIVCRRSVWTNHRQSFSRQRRSAGRRLRPRQDRRDTSELALSA